jgi:cyclic di-GMP phosphodiesterase
MSLSLREMSDRPSVTVKDLFLSQTQSSAWLLQKLLASSVIRPSDWEALSAEVQMDLTQLSRDEELLDQLVERKLLTKYQAGRVLAGKTFGLVLGNYRVLDRLGAGGMGVVFQAEHLHLPRLAAVKIVPIPRDEDPRVLQRFRSEMCAIAQMQHPHIVGAMDAGVVEDTDSHSPPLHYFVMDYVAGENLEDRVQTHGPLSTATACKLIQQVASALREAHAHDLVHRDIKPSNVLVTPEEQAKLLDFGLVRHFSHRMTEPGTTLGTLDYLAPEQARDASTVDIRADIYGLGGTLFWCLTGRTPFPSRGNAIQGLLARLTQMPPTLRNVRPDVPTELETVVSCMMAVDPERRYQTPQAVMQALLPFLPTDMRQSAQMLTLATENSRQKSSLDERQTAASGHRVLIVDDEPVIRSLCRYALQGAGLFCDEAANGRLAWESLQTHIYDLVVSDSDMPEMNGLELLQRLRESPPTPHLKVIMISGRVSGDEMAHMLSQGADDYLTKPLSIGQFLSRVKAALRLKDAQDRTDLLNQHLLHINAQLEQNLTARDSDLAHARNALVLALAELLSHRETESPGHMPRLQKYCRRLAEIAATFPSFAPQLDANFIQMLECCAPLRDIGKVGVPDHILLKPGQLDADERTIMQSHTTIGADTLQKVAQKHGFAAAFLQMASDIARHHHERFDGKGYPDRLAGDDIPLSARIVAIADVYDGLRSRRPYKPALSHSAAMQTMAETATGHFDPLLWQAFRLCASDFEQIAAEVQHS